MASNSKPTPNAAQANGGFSIVRVLTLVVGIAAVGGVGYFCWDMLQKPPALAPFSGRVMFDGKPVASGGISTMRIEDNLDGAIATLDAEGRFVLNTNGENGALIGKHKVVISAFSPGMPPSPLVPAVYTSMATTPLVIEVTEDPTKNTVDWVLEGEVSNTAPPTSAGPPTLPTPQNIPAAAEGKSGTEDAAPSVPSDEPTTPTEQSEKK